MEYKGWLATLQGDTRELVFATMRSIRAESDRYYTKGNELGRRAANQVAVGCADFDELVRGQSLAHYLRSISNGLTPTEALAEAKQEARSMITNHNAKRKDINWKRDAATADNTIEYQHSRLIDSFMRR